MAACLQPAKIRPVNRAINAAGDMKFSARCFYRAVKKLPGEALYMTDFKLALPFEFMRLGVMPVGVMCCPVSMMFRIVMMVMGMMVCSHENPSCNESLPVL